VKLEKDVFQVDEKQPALVYMTVKRGSIGKKDCGRSKRKQTANEIGNLSINRLI
jgi:hypothetical protein